MMKLRISNRYRKWLIVPPVLLAAVVVVFLVSRRGGPEHEAEREQSHAVRVIVVSTVDVVPRALGYGTAQPGQVWKAVSEVKGRVLEVHPNLESGTIVQQGEVLLQIDPVEHQLAVTQFEADIAQVESQLEELAVKETNDRASLEIEEASLILTQRDLQRRKSLLERNAVAAAEVDQVLSQGPADPLEAIYWADFAASENRLNKPKKERANDLALLMMME